MLNVLSESLGKASISDPIGTFIELNLINQSHLVGFIFALNDKLVVLQESISKTPNIHIVYLDSILGVKIIDSKKTKNLVIPQAVSINKIQEKERVALRNAKHRSSKIGVGVTPQGQSIFYALSKTMPTAWKDKDIIVMEDIIISPPYKTIKIVSGKTSINVERVQKVLDGERARLNILS